MAETAQFCLVLRKEIVFECGHLSFDHSLGAFRQRY